MAKEQARLAAMAAGEARYATERPCLRGHMGLRYAGTGACVPCQDDKRAVRVAAKQALRASERETLPRELARAAGATRYFTGEPCKQGHIAERAVGDAKCVECVAIRRRRWLADEETATLTAMRKAKWAEDNAEYVREQKRVKFQNCDKAEHAKKTLQWYYDNEDRARAHRRTTRQRYPWRGRAHAAARNKRVKQAIVPGYTDLAEIRKIAALRPHGYDTDHIVPLKAANQKRERIACGLHVTCNLQYLSKAANSAKSNRWSEGSKDSCAIVPFSWEHFLVISEQA